MNREEFANKWAAVEIYEDGLPISIVIQARYNDLLADLNSLSLPPAEGAEEIRREYSEESLGFFRSFIKARKELCAISPTETYSLEEAIRKAFDGFFPKPLSIVNDAETILNSHPYLKVWVETLFDSEMKVCSIEQAIWAIERAATLHAQRIAEKMVNERSEFIKKAVIRFFYTEVDLNFCTREYRDRVEWYFNTYQHEIFKLPKTSLDNFKSREK